MIPLDYGADITRYLERTIATSTGGMTNKHPGRVGDSPLIGSGTDAADDTCAISCTGKGEQSIRHHAGSGG